MCVKKFNFFVSDLMLFHVCVGGHLGEKKKKETSWIPGTHWMNGNKLSGLYTDFLGPEHGGPKGEKHHGPEHGGKKYQAWKT